MNYNRISPKQTTYVTRQWYDLYISKFVGREWCVFLENESFIYT